MKKDYPEYRATPQNPHHISCGGVVYRIGKSGPEVMLLHKFQTPKWVHDSWHLPKGTQRIDESEKDCAAREIREETGYEVEVKEKLGSWESTDDSWGFKFNKTTHYFICKLMRKAGLADREHDEVKWVELDEAIKRLKDFPIWEAEDEVLIEFKKRYNSK